MPTLVVFLRGVNVGGHRTFRPAELAKRLKAFDVVNVGAAGTFVVRKPGTRARLRAELARRLPFETEMMICDGRDVLRLTSTDPFSGQPGGASIVRFVSVLDRRRPAIASLPIAVPTHDDPCLQIIAHRDQFILGVHRREMRAIGFLGRLDKIVGARVTTRSWTTMLAIARILSTP